MLSWPTKAKGKGLVCISKYLLWIKFLQKFILTCLIVGYMYVYIYIYMCVCVFIHSRQKYKVVLRTITLYDSSLHCSIQKTTPLTIHALQNYKHYIAYNP